MAVSSCFCSSPLPVRVPWPLSPAVGVFITPGMARGLCRQAELSAHFTASSGILSAQQRKGGLWRWVRRGMEMVCLACRGQTMGILYVAPQWSVKEKGRFYFWRTHCLCEISHDGGMWKQGAQPRQCSASMLLEPHSHPAPMPFWDPGCSVCVPFQVCDALCVPCRCTVDDRVTRVAWLNRSTILYAGNDKWSIDNRVVIVSNTKTQYSIKIHNVDIYDEGPYTCSVQTDNHPKTSRVHLIVQGRSERSSCCCCMV